MLERQDMHCLYSEGPWWHHGKPQCYYINSQDDTAVAMTCEICFGEHCTSVWSFSFTLIGLLILSCCCCCICHLDLTHLRVLYNIAFQP